MKSRGSVVLLLLTTTEVDPEPGPKPGVEPGVKPGSGFLGSAGCEKPAFNETAGRKGVRRVLLHELPSLKSRHISRTEIKPFSVFPFHLESLVPVCLDSGRIIGTDYVNRCRFFRKL
jgi:hypothetical protein